MKCYRCGLPQFDGPAGYVGPQCKCFWRWPQQVEPPKPVQWTIPTTTAPAERVPLSEILNAARIALSAIEQERSDHQLGTKSWNRLNVALDRLQVIESKAHYGIMGES